MAALEIVSATHAMARQVDRVRLRIPLFSRRFIIFVRSLSSVFRSKLGELDKVNG